MLTLDMLEKQTNKVRFTIEDKTIAIGGFIGGGKTATVHELFKILEKETGNKYIGTNCVFEDRYKMYEGYKKIVPPLKDYYNENEELRNEIIDENPEYIHSYAHLLDYVDLMVETKLKNPEFPVKIICFDPLSILEGLIHKHLLWEYYEENGIWVSKEKYGNYGRIYTDATTRFIREIKDKLESAGYKIWFTFHMKDKKFNDPILGEHDTYVSENSNSFFSEVLKGVDFSIIFESTAFVSNKKLENTERILRWRDGNNYRGAKATGETFPETQNIQGLSDSEIAQLIVDTIVRELKNKARVKDEQFNELVEAQRKENENKEIKVLNKMKSINKKTEIKNEEKEKRQKVINTIKWMLKLDLEEDTYKAINNTIESWKQKYNVVNSDELLKVASSDFVNMIIDTINGWFDGSEEYVALERI
jgi:hypothetical protein